MAKPPRVTTRRGKVGVYWRDALGHRHFVVAQDGVARAHLLEQLQGSESPDASTVSQYAEVWLERVRIRSAQPTHACYTRNVRNHVHGAEIGQTRLADLSRPQLKAWVVAMLDAGATARTVGLRVSIVRAMLQEAVEDGLISRNPAEALVRAMRLSMKSKDVPGVDAGAAARLLEVARADPQFPGIALLIHTGLRIGEAMGLRWDDVDWEAREARIERQAYVTGDLAGLKTEKSRRVVQLPLALVEMMRSWRARQQEAALRTRTAASGYVLGVEPEDSRNGRDRIREALGRACKRAGLPHLRLHALRHAFASLQLSMGADLKWVQEQLGHSVITTTADLYGSHLRRKNAEAADALGNLLQNSQLRLFRKK